MGGIDLTRSKMRASIQLAEVSPSPEGTLIKTEATRKQEDLNFSPVAVKGSRSSCRSLSCCDSLSFKLSQIEDAQHYSQVMSEQECLDQMKRWSSERGASIMEINRQAELSDRL